MAKHKAGDIVIAKNGYSYTYATLNGGELDRYLTHHLIGFEKYGRLPSVAERAVFVDNDRTNLDPDNIEYQTKQESALKALRRRKATLEDRIKEYTNELKEVNESLKQLERSNSNGEEV